MICSTQCTLYIFYFYLQEALSDKNNVLPSLSHEIERLYGELDRHKVSERKREKGGERERRRGKKEKRGRERRGERCMGLTLHT